MDICHQRISLRCNTNTSIFHRIALLLIWNAIATASRLGVLFQRSTKSTKNCNSSQLCAASPHNFKMAFLFKLALKAHHGGLHLNLIIITWLHACCRPIFTIAIEWTDVIKELACGVIPASSTQWHSSLICKAAATAFSLIYNGVLLERSRKSP